MTKIIKINPNNIDADALWEAAEILKGGGLCAFPTETVYGLGADATNADAVGKIFLAKGRPQDNPLIVHISRVDEVYPLVKTIPPKAPFLMERFWGGPLTLIMERSDVVAPEVSAGLGTVAIRLVSHPVANALIRMSGVPVAAPSANISGRPSPTAAAHVIQDLMGRVDCIIDGGNTFYGIESTVLDLTEEVPVILRPGAVTAEEIRDVIGEVSFGAGEGAPKSPGMKYTHYSPDAEVYGVEYGTKPQINRDGKTGVLSYGEQNIDADIILHGGGNAEEYAACLFYNLREFDARGAKTIYAVLPPPGGMGDAVRNRLLKAAGGRIIQGEKL